MNNKSISQKLLKIKQRLKRFNIHELILLIYMVVLCFVLLVGPIMKMSPIWWDVLKFRLFSKSFAWIAVIILLCLVVLIWWNFSTKFKNLFLTYFGWRENDSLINFLFLCIMITAFLAVQNSVSIASRATSTISLARGWKFLLVWLLIGIIFSLVSLVKWAQKTWKKTKIINVVDDEHKQWEAIKEEIKKWLFDEEAIDQD